MRLCQGSPARPPGLHIDGCRHVWGEASPLPQKPDEMVVRYCQKCGTDSIASAHHDGSESRG